MHFLPHVKRDRPLSRPCDAHPSAFPLPQGTNDGGSVLARSVCVCVLVGVGEEDLIR